MDLGRADDEAEATADLLAAAALDLGDFFTFRGERVIGFDESVEGAAVRYRLRAELAGRLFEEVLVDVGFSPVMALGREQLRGLDLLEFAGISPIEVPAIPLAQHVAEKVHAYTRSYGDGQTSTRVKDLVDMVFIALSCTIEAEELRRALEATFTVGQPTHFRSGYPHHRRSGRSRTASWRRSWTCLGN
jgi:hypothetical protein